MKTVKQKLYISGKPCEDWEQPDYKIDGFGVSINSYDPTKLGGGRGVLFATQEVQVSIPENLTELYQEGRVVDIDEEIKKIRAEAQLKINHLQEEKQRLLCIEFLPNENL